MWREEFKAGHDEAITKLKSQQNEIEEEENFRLKGSIFYDCIGIIGEGLVLGGLPLHGMVMRGVTGFLDGGHTFYSKENILKKLENAEKILKKYDTSRIKMNSYLSLLGVKTFSSLKGLIKEIQHIISHIKSSNTWKWLPDILYKESLNLYQLFNLDNEKALKEDSFMTGASIVHRLTRIGFNFYDIMNGKMCDEANVLENIIEEIQSEYDDLEKILF